MEQIRIEGGRPLFGEVTVQGAKNAALPILAATILSMTPVTLEGIPCLRDVETMKRLLKALGLTVVDSDDSLFIRGDRMIFTEAPYELVRRMRASVLVAGPLLARAGHIHIALPGGCAIGSRPIDLHLKGFRALGAEVNVRQGSVECFADRLVGNKIYLDYPSVTATENIMMAATLAEGGTIIENAAEEPEVCDLASFLCHMGARISGAGSKTIKIEGVDRLAGSTYTVIPDRIAAGTYIIAVAAAGGSVQLNNVIPAHLKSVIAKLGEAGVRIWNLEDRIVVESDRRPTPLSVTTLPYPGFPTDLQAPLSVLLSLAPGTSLITETVFENRFRHLDELKRMGADIRVEGRTAVIEGVAELSGAEIEATDLRAGAALVIAGLAARGESRIFRPHHIDRGYASLIEDLRDLGAEIQLEGRVSDSVNILPLHRS